MSSSSAASTDASWMTRSIDRAPVHADLQPLASLDAPEEIGRAVAEVA
jgi:hypothetical protein